MDEIESLRAELATVKAENERLNKGWGDCNSALLDERLKNAGKIHPVDCESCAALRAELATVKAELAALRRDAVPREPTEPMIKEGQATMFWGGTAPEIWRAMYDAALGSQPEGSQVSVRMVDARRLEAAEARIRELEGVALQRSSTVNVKGGSGPGDNFPASPGNHSRSEA